MKSHRIICVVSVLAVILLSLVPFVCAASDQYTSQQTVNVTFGSNELAHVDQSATGGLVSIDISGTANAGGSVSVASYSGNPQPSASAPVNTMLTNFVVITFDISVLNFHGANIVFHYNASSVASILPPYSLYKYDAASNSYHLLNGIVDTNAQTITVSVTNPTDPLFAIGGLVADKPAAASGTPSWIWIAAALVGVTIVGFVVGAVTLSKLRKPSYEIVY